MARTRHTHMHQQCRLTEVKRASSERVDNRRCWRNSDPKQCAAMSAAGESRLAILEGFDPDGDRSPQPDNCNEAPPRPRRRAKPLSCPLEPLPTRLVEDRYALLCAAAASL